MDLLHITAHATAATAAVSVPVASASTSAPWATICLT